MQKNKITNNGKMVALGGLLTALGVICLYLAAVLPTTRLTFGAICSMFVFIMVVEFGVKAGFILYLATCVLGVLIVPLNSILVLYIGFLGYYGIIKYYIEKFKRLWLEWAIKIIFFNIIIFALYFISMQIPSLKGLIETGTGKFAVWSTIGLGEIAFVCYDYGYSIVIGYYMQRIRKLLRFID